MRRKRKSMTARFVRETEIAASLAPFGTVRRNTTASGAVVRDEMRQLMTQGPIDFRPAVLAEPRIQRNDRSAKMRTPRRAAQP